MVRVYHVNILEQLPNGLVHVVSGPDVIVLFPQFDGLLRVAFQVPLGQVSIQTSQSEHYFHHLKTSTPCPNGKPSVTHALARQ